MVNVSANRQNMVLLVLANNVQKPIKQRLIPEGLLSLIVVKPEEDVGLSNEFCIWVSRQKFLKPIQHHRRSISYIDIVIGEGINSV